jgi:hypothetical protein
MEINKKVINMEDPELGCTHRSECINYQEKCKECSAHYTNEFNDGDDEDE